MKNVKPFLNGERLPPYEQLHPKYGGSATPLVLSLS